MTHSFTKALTALALGATALSAAPALADQPSYGYAPGHGDRDDRGRDDHGRDDHGRNGYDRDDRDHRDRDEHRDRDGGQYRGRNDYRGDDRQGDRQGNRRPGGVIHSYDYNRPDPRYRGYYAERYYRGGYAPIRVTRATRIYRGADDRYYCRRSDGTTGLIVGAALGGLIGNRLERGQSSVAGTLLGATTGALLGREIDRGNLNCR